jgi:putative oxidoreductase
MESTLSTQAPDSDVEITEVPQKSNPVQRADIQRADTVRTPTLRQFGEPSSRRTGQPQPSSLTDSHPRGVGWLLKDGGRVPKLEAYGTLAARVLLSQIFLISGIIKLVDWSGTEVQMEGHGMALTPLFHILAAAIELGGGLCLLCGFKSRIAALVLCFYLSVVTLTFHDFWNNREPKMRQINTMFFMHNIALGGGLLLLTAYGPGPYSIGTPKRRSPRVRAVPGLRNASIRDD